MSKNISYQKRVDIFKTRLILIGLIGTLIFGFFLFNYSTAELYVNIIDLKDMHIFMITLCEVLFLASITVVFVVITIWRFERGTIHLK